jgi:hypothetical protein
MPKMGGGSDESGGPPKRPSAVAGPQKQAAVSSPSQAAASRQAAIAKSRAAEVEPENGSKSEKNSQMAHWIGIGFFVLTMVGLLAWYVIFPSFGFGGSNLFIRPFRNPDFVIDLPVFDVSKIKVDPSSLSIRPGQAGLKMLKGSVRNEGKNPARNIKITVQIVGGLEPIEITHTVNDEVQPSQAVEFSAPLSFDAPPNPKFTVKEIEILDPRLSD